MKNKLLIVSIIILMIGSILDLPAKKIDLYGYSNFLFTYNTPGSRDGTYSFSQNRTNLLFSSEFFNRWDFFVNVEFKGAFNIRSNEYKFIDSNETITESIITEATESLELEEAWTRFTASEKFKIRIGQFHAPFGPFNVIQDAAPTYISVRPPLIYDDNVRNENPVSIVPDKANIELSGLFRFSTFNMEYYLYAGSSELDRSPSLIKETDMSFGTRFLLNFDENIKLGFSTYFVNRTFFNNNEDNTIVLDESLKTDIKPNSERRSSFSMDLDISLGKFNINTEYILNRNNNPHLGKFNRTFFYINLNTEIFKKIRIYTEFDSYKDDSPALDIRSWYGKGLNKSIVGINYKPNWITAIKAEVEYNYFRGKESKGTWCFSASLSVIF